jgi:hypothetical protein
MPSTQVPTHQGSFPAVSHILRFALLEPMTSVDVVAEFVVQRRAEHKVAG